MFKYLVLLVGLFVGSVQAENTYANLFQCSLGAGVSINVIKHRDHVTLMVLNAKAETLEEAENALLETGVGREEISDTNYVEFVDLMVGDIQYTTTVVYENNSITNGVLSVFDDNRLVKEYRCLKDTVVSNLSDTKITAGIFKP